MIITETNLQMRRELYMFPKQEVAQDRQTHRHPQHQSQLQR